MEVENFVNGFNTFSYFGVTLNPEKQHLVHKSLIILKNDAHFKEIYLWGIIHGLQSDYYISFGYQKDALTGRIYYYSKNCIEWLLLPIPKEEDFKLASTCVSKFQGDPSFAAITDNDTTATASEEEPVPESGDAIKAEGKLKEEDRLAVTVALINDEVMIVPRGALHKGPDGVVIKNKAFNGVSYIEVDEMRSYLHYRVPKFKWNTNLLTRKDYNYGIDFLDTIDADKPTGQWIMQQAEGGKTTYLQHLAWPGYFFYYIIGTTDFASFYKGDGKKNLDIPFML